MPPSNSIYRIRSRRYTRAGLLLALLVFGGCGSTEPFVLPEAPEQPTETEIELRLAVDDWHGSPYEWGGDTRLGLDCSAFTQILYRDVFGVDIPRTTRTQVMTGVEVSPSELQPGDLVFFHPRDDLRHVGVYVGRGEFAHVSSSQGVTISQLNRPYWRKRYWTARRPALQQTEDEEPSRPGEHAFGRKGW